MIRYFLFIIFFFNAVQTFTQGILEKFPPKSNMSPDSSTKTKLRTYQNIPAFSFAGWNECLDHIYSFARLDAEPQLYMQTQPKGSLQVKTHFPQRVAGIQFNPNSNINSFLYLQDDQGDEQFKLSLYDMNTQKSKALGPKSGRIASVLWGESGKHFLYTHTPEGKSNWDIYVGDAQGNERRLFSQAGAWEPMAWSVNEKQALFLRSEEAHSELFLYSFEDSSLTQLLKDEPKQNIVDAFWIENKPFSGDTLTRPSPRKFAFVSDRQGEYSRVFQGSLDTLLISPLTPEMPWDIEWSVLSPNTHYLIYSVNENGFSKIYNLDIRKGVTDWLQEIPKGIVSPVSFRKNSKGFAFNFHDVSQPGSVYTYDIERKYLESWSPQNTLENTPQKILAPIVTTSIQFPSIGSPAKVPEKKKISIQAFVYKPQIESNRPFPVLIQFHGGPELQARPDYDAFMQYVVRELNVVVITPNVRGSTGYGKRFQSLDDGKLRMNSVEDIGALLGWIKTQPDLDSRRIAVMGRSYGGFMSLSALIHYGDQIKAGISTVGITHFPKFLENTSEYRRDLRRAEYGDERDPQMRKFLEKISPFNLAHKIKVPLLLAHGAKDPRVPIGESERLFASLQKRKVPVWFLHFPDEGHAFREKENELYYEGIVSEFLRQNLLNHTTAMK